MAQRKVRGVLAFIELQLVDDGDSVATEDERNADQVRLLSAFQGVAGDEVEVTFNGRQFVLLLEGSSTAQAHQKLRKLGRQISACAAEQRDTAIPVTPAIGYVDMRLAATMDRLWQMAAAALDYAKSSLDIEPFRYELRLEGGPKRDILTRLSGLWSKAPSSVAIGVQFLMSSILGLGVPFFIYAVFDALGIDISGAIYIGVVIVLLITATLIWLEGFLALKRTAPPETPALAYPPATLIIPAYMPNEADTIVETLGAFLRLDYPNTVQIIIAYNVPGSLRLPVEDELAAIASDPALAGRFVIEPIRVAGSTSKAQNVNAVVGRATGKFVGIFDADHHPLPDSLLRAWRWLSNGWDIVQGRCAIRNGADSWVARMVAIEFEQIYSVSHPGRARLHGFGIFGGSNGFWRTEVLDRIRMRHSMLTEDIDSSIRAITAGYSIASDRDLVSEELAPTSLAQLLNQRLRWAQGWFQVSLQRIGPALLSPHISLRQKLGLTHLLVWRELFPWYSIQVVPIMGYWVWVHGWSYIHWAIPIFVFTTIYTLSTGPGQVLFAYALSRKDTRCRTIWFVEYLFVSMVFYATFKDTISRIAHLKEAMRERAWRVTPRIATVVYRPQVAAAALVLMAAFAFALVPGPTRAAAGAQSSGLSFSRRQLGVLIGGEVATIDAARRAAQTGRNAQAAKLFEQAIAMVPRRRPELLPEYADSLLYGDRSAEAAPIYRELLSSQTGARQLETRSRLALALTWSRQYPAALAAYTQIVDQHPGDAGAAVRRAGVLVRLDRHLDAVKALDQVNPAGWASGEWAVLGEEILVDAARAEAKAGRHDAAAGLFRLAFAHNGALRARYLKEYADQLTFASKAEDAVPLYRELLAQPGLDKTMQRDLQRSLALALTWSGAKTKALGEWSTYLEAGGSDIDAMLHRAQLFETLKRGPEALQTYREAYKAYPRSEAARRGLADQTVKLARVKAAADKNSESAELFAAAITLDGRVRNDVMREYADQLRYSHRLSQAISTYQAVLVSKALSPSDRKRAMSGLAEAFVAEKRPAEALATYTAAVETFPNDIDAKLDRLLFVARQAALNDRNEESAAAFGEAIKIAPARSQELLREYADQLTFSGRSADAVPLYQRVLAGSPLPLLERKRASKGLAEALALTGRPAEAAARYVVLLHDFPDDLDLNRDYLIFSARQAARTDRNKEAAAFFSKAIELQPARSAELLREYADQLSFTDRATEAAPLYSQVLTQPGLSLVDKKQAGIGLAKAYGSTGQPAEGLKVFAKLVSDFPDDADVRWESLVFAGRQAAIVDKNADAANHFAQAIKLDYKRSLPILREYADQLSFSGRSGNAVAIYQAFLAQPDLPPADLWAAKKGLSHAYEWSGNLGSARATLIELTSHFPGDASLKWDLLVTSAREAAKNDKNKEAADLFADAIRLLPAQRMAILKEYADKLTFSGQSQAAIPLYREVLAKPAGRIAKRDAQLDLALAFVWSKQLPLAIAEYESLLQADPSDTEAAIGKARILSWTGRQVAAKETYSLVLGRDPTNAEAKRGLAQVEDWLGHHKASQAILAERLKEAPNDLEARRLLAQSQAWAGRPDKALSEINRALKEQKSRPPTGRQTASLENFQRPMEAGSRPPGSQ